MYRRYENPAEVQKMLEKAKERLSRLQAESDDPDIWIDTLIEITELEERLIAAWQDDEYNENYELANYGEDDE